MADNAIVENLYAQQGVSAESFPEAFFFRITIPCGVSTPWTTYDRPYVVYPLTGGKLRIDVREVGAQEPLSSDLIWLAPGLPYLRDPQRVSESGKVEVSVFNMNEECDPGAPIIILKG